MRKSYRQHTCLEIFHVGVLSQKRNNNFQFQDFGDNFEKMDQSEKQVMWTKMDVDILDIIEKLDNFDFDQRKKKRTKVEIKDKMTSESHCSRL